MQASERALQLAERLRQVASNLIEVVEPIEEDRWHSVPAPGVWSIGKEAEHVADAGAYHQWIVRLTIGEKVSARRPPIERIQMTSDLSPAQVVELIQSRTDEGIRLISGLSDAQLDLETRPPRARGQRLAETIERVLIGHYGVHRADIEAKLAAELG